ncbi:hypothetical protein JCGZ_14233 [Jatropha curcas]|uniref:MYB family protein n=1 Tax=Jatropha curcas TaxID=180498 RepID=A0A067JX53_JATCU|nr:myb-related protein 308 isoform X1 [Jatropha curcas]AIT52283.1 MYB family protein [Jatropha curcas]KDP28462.1 hypothetical protein JCGZ_14233 [Jatropha curcas]
MGRAPCCSKVGLHRGPWTPREDTLLIKYIQAHGEGNWRSLPKKAGLLRCGKSCRLRWMNYLRPDIKRGNITPDEDDLIIRMHSLLGNRWSLIAGRLPGRTDNEIKNYWNTHLSKKLRSQGTDPHTHKKLPEPILQEGTKKKKKNNNNNKKNTKSKEKMEPEKPKIHLPIPVRFTCLSLPRNDSFECNSLCSSAGGEGGSSAEAVVGNNWFNFKENDDHGISFLVGDVGHEFVNGTDHDDLAPTESGNLEKLYEEYLLLLKTDDRDQVKLDSFAESLLL